ncbi:MAG TPA: non-canonical purine NTP pyrophosphatase [Porticoccaceae bacterium]|nr:non-canonical purine NTP pyrophosphatase [Porticoccaceae bacterium]
MTSRFVLASGNDGKLEEFRQLLEGRDIHIVSQNQFNIQPVEETGLSFVENAIIKARHACRYAELPALADDSGLEVDFLNGAPGIYSARFAGEGADDTKNNRRLLELLQGVPAEQRSARFQCVLVYLRHPQDPTPIICQGTWEGRILTEPLGDQGFGYDPLFFIPELDCTAAELPAPEKNRLSHRARAMQELLQQILG